MATKKSFVVKSGLDASANAISNLGVSSASLTLSGANAVTLTSTGATNVTLPTSGTLLYSGGALGTPASGNLSNCTFPTLNQNTTGSSGSCTGNAATATTASSCSGNSATATKMNSQGAYTNAAPGTTRGSTGLNLYEVYNNGYPTTYGNLLHMYGAGAGQLLVGWSGSDGADAGVYVRSKRDNDAGAWSAWREVITAANIGSQSVTYATSAGSITSQANSATITATSANTINQIVLRDGSGNFSAGVMSGTATTARYADLAENYVSDQSYDYGIVLMIGGDEEVTIATEETQKLAGVVSKNPAYLMNSECEGEHVVAIALQGRTPVRVKGKVNKGDFLVSAGDGYAKATDNPKIGSIIGKSLESFDGQYGMVEAMVGRL